MEHDLTRGNVLKTIAVFALPYMLSYFYRCSMVWPTCT